MKKLLVIALPGVLLAQPLEGIWQGVLKPRADRELRVVFKITKNGGAFEGTLYQIDQRIRHNFGAISLQSKAVRIVIPGLGATYEGTLEGDTIQGSVTQGSNPLPLTLRRPTPETAWELTPAPAAPKGLPEGTKLEFDVATIKPAPVGQQGSGFGMTGRQLRGRNTSLLELIVFAFRLHAKQISGLPSWAQTDRYDVLGQIPKGGNPKRMSNSGRC